MTLFAPVPGESNLRQVLREELEKYPVAREKLEALAGIPAAIEVVGGDDGAFSLSSGDSLLIMELDKDTEMDWTAEKDKVHPEVIRVTSSDYDEENPPHQGGPGLKVEITEWDKRTGETVHVFATLREVGNNPDHISVLAVVNIYELAKLAKALQTAVDEYARRTDLELASTVQGVDGGSGIAPIPFGVIRHVRREHDEEGSLGRKRGVYFEQWHHEGGAFQTWYAVDSEGIRCLECVCPTDDWETYQDQLLLTLDEIDPIGDGDGDADEEEDSAPELTDVRPVRFERGVYQATRNGRQVLYACTSDGRKYQECELRDDGPIAAHLARGLWEWLDAADPLTAPATPTADEPASTNAEIPVRRELGPDWTFRLPVGASPSEVVAAIRAHSIEPQVRKRRVQTERFIQPVDETVRQFAYVETAWEEWQAQDDKELAYHLEIASNVLDVESSGPNGASGTSHRISATFQGVVTLYDCLGELIDLVIKEELTGIQSEVAQ